MPSSCSVFGCFSNFRHRGNLSFHSFPKDKELRKKWIHLCKRKDFINANNAVICSLHFETSAFERNLKYELLGQPVPKALVRIKNGALPTLQLPSSKEILKSSTRESRAEKRGRKKLLQDMEVDESEVVEPPVLTIEELQCQVEELRRERDALLIEKAEWEKERISLHNQLRSVAVEANVATKNALLPFFSSSQVDLILTKKPVTNWVEDDEVITAEAPYDRSTTELQENGFEDTDKDPLGDVMESQSSNGRHNHEECVGSSPPVPYISKVGGGVSSILSQTLTGTGRENDSINDDDHNFDKLVEVKAINPFLEPKLTIKTDGEEIVIKDDKLVEVKALNPFLEPELTVKTDVEEIVIKDENVLEGE